MHADLIFYGSVLTMDEARPRAGGVAVAGGRVVAVGSAADLHPLAGPATRSMQLNGACLLPGFHDSHVHFVRFGQQLEQLDLTITPTVASALELVAERARGLPADAWVMGAGFALHRWGLTTIGESEAAALEEAAGGRAVFLSSQDHHSAWLSRAALRAAGISSSTPDPAGGVIGRDSHGEPTGLLLETATQLVRSALPEHDLTTIRRWVELAAREFASLGVTSAHSMAYEPPELFRELALAASGDAFPVRVWACIPHAKLEEAASLGVATNIGGDTFRVGGAKFFVDGALGSRTAWMLEPYSGSGDSGMVVDDPELLAERVPLAIAAGLTPVLHAIGDAATRAVVDILEATQAEWRTAGLRPRLEHAQHMHPADVQRAGRLGLVASMQPTHLTFDVESILELLGDRVERAYPMRSLKRAGAHLAFGSDAPVAPPDVFDGLRAAARRMSVSGARLASSEALAPDEALAAYTTGGAYAIRAEAHSGRLAPGFDADLVVLSHDPTVSLDGLSVVATMKGGRFTHGEEALS